MRLDLVRAAFSTRRDGPRVGDPEELARLLNDESFDPHDWSWLEATEEAWLEILRRFPERRKTVVLNKRLPSKILAILAKEPSRRIRSSVLYKAKLPREVLELLARDPAEEIRESVAGHSSTPSELLETLSFDRAVAVRRAARKRLGMAAPCDLRECTWPPSTLTTEDAIAFLRTHQPMPPDDDIDSQEVWRYVESLAEVGRSQPPGAIGLILGSLDEHSVIGAADEAIATLLDFPEKVVRAELLSRLEAEPTPDNVGWIARVAWDFKNPALEPYFLSWIGHPSAAARLYSAAGLGELATPAAREALEKALSLELDAEVRWTIEQALTGPYSAWRNRTVRNDDS